MGKIAILGAGGKLGTRLVHEALAQEMQVNAVTRDPKKLRLANANFNVFQGDTEKGEGLESAVLGCRWVVSVVSSNQPSTCVANLLKALKQRWVDRLVFVARSDDTVPAHGLSKLSGILHRKEVAKDLGTALELLQVSGLPYLVLRTTGLTDGPGGKEVLAGADGHVSRVDLARFILNVLNAPEWGFRDAIVGTH